MIADPEAEQVITLGDPQALVVSKLHQQHSSKMSDERRFLSSSPWPHERVRNRQAGDHAEHAD